MVGTSFETGNGTDTELVALSRRGSRDAFGRIVRRYQGMIAGAAYCVCGDLHASEDLAQETFLSAWKSLSGLSDPEKLSPWLCQIVRRKAVDYQRSKARGRNRLGQLFRMTAGASEGTPATETLEAEEREMLWKYLSQLPEPYRETLVLYYRQEESARAVAAAMETSEELVRQRLTRGRAMLREEVARRIETGLAQTAPGEGLATAVIAALAPGAGQVATASLGAAAKGASTTLGGALFLWTSILAGPLVAGGVAAQATWRELRAKRTAGERWFIVGYSILAALFVGAFYFSFAMPPRFLWHGDRYGYRQDAVMVGITALGTAVIAAGRRQLRLMNEGALARACRKIPARLRLVVVISSTLWMLRLAWIVRDWTGMGIVAGVIAGLCVVSIVWLNTGNRFVIGYIPMLAVAATGVIVWLQPGWISETMHRPIQPIPIHMVLRMDLFFGCCWVFAMALLIRPEKMIDER
jgi:RNA polymerase sigma factor (sigma-70 family)